MGSWMGSGAGDCCGCDGSWNLQETLFQKDQGCHTTCMGSGCGGKGLDVAAGGVQAAGADLAALQDAQWPCPQHVFLLMPRQAELNKENLTKVASVSKLGMPSLWWGWAGIGAREVQEFIAGWGEE